MARLQAFQTLRLSQTDLFGIRGGRGQDSARARGQHHCRSDGNAQFGARQISQDGDVAPQFRGGCTESNRAANVIFRLAVR